MEEVSDKELIEKAIDGMLSGIDPHSGYMNVQDPNTYVSITQLVRQQFELIFYKDDQVRRLQDYLCGKLYKQGVLDRPRKVSTTMLIEAGKKLQAQ